jgi:hypothetical protein
VATRGVLISLALIGFLAVALSPSTAHAENNAHAIGGTTALLLLDGFRVQASESAAAGQPATPRRHVIGSGGTTPDPEETLTQAVERMWSQVRAYRRPGGAEVIVRGHF